ncbi:hypothetical protein [Methylobacterium sp. J-077]|uniref:hypothetical protein n=1 Tax=Methylobacterium sp. J-077 TaxID=2836656 RepID=UPI001FBB984A|nr:hypothetical protein [Methylobacterium sp. J-077]MCJ2125846.1 hypothetical protein [Methylobacterium sp. J-077]
MSKSLSRNAPAGPRTSLRERAADVEASAARVLKRASMVKATAEPVAAASISELRDRWRAALEAANRPGLPEAAFRRLSTVVSDAEQAIINAPIRTIHDLACQVEVLRANFDLNSLDEGVPFATVQAVCDGIDSLAATSRSDPVDLIQSAIATHRKAFIAANSQPTEELSELACQTADHLYKALAAITPTTPAGLCALATHLRRFLRDSGIEVGNTFQEEALTILLDAAERFAARQAGSRPAEAQDENDWAMPHAYAVDLSGLRIQELGNLWDVYTSVRDQWQAVSELPFCTDHHRVGVRGHTPAGTLADAEGTRAAFIRDRIADEVRLREPQNEWERSVALSLRIKSEILCEGAIRDRDLFMEAVKAWG